MAKNVAINSKVTDKSGDSAAADKAKAELAGSAAPGNGPGPGTETKTESEQGAMSEAAPISQKAWDDTETNVTAQGASDAASADAEMDNKPRAADGKLYTTNGLGEFVPVQHDDGNTFTLKELNDMEGNFDTQARVLRETNTEHGSMKAKLDAAEAKYRSDRENMEKEITRLNQRVKDLESANSKKRDSMGFDIPEGL